MSKTITFLIEIVGKFYSIQINFKTQREIKCVREGIGRTHFFEI